VQKNFSARVLVPAFMLACSELVFAVPCTPGMIIIGPAPLTTGVTLTQSGTFCTLGSLAVSNFTVYGAAIGAPIGSWTLSTGAATNASSLVFDLAYTNLGASGLNTIQLTFNIAPGINSVGLSAGPGVTVTELMCSVPTGAGGSCSGTILTQNSSLSASNGGSSSSTVTAAATDYVFKSISGGSETTQTWTVPPPTPPPPSSPAPPSLILLVLGLASLGTFLALSRRRVRA
jgi:hypothetical protein